MCAAKDLTECDGPPFLTPSLFPSPPPCAQYGAKFDLISTFTLTQGQGATQCSGPAMLADCMTAACYIKTAFDGSPVTCYCPVFSVAANVTFLMGSHLGEPIPCEQPEGYVMSSA